jgi:hypothetical protein
MTDEEISNPNLLKKKLEELNQFKEQINPADFPFALACNYHGILLNLRTSSQKFIDSLTSFIPPEWIQKPSSANPIYIMSPEEFNYSMADWCDEISQDCLTYKYNTIAVQRDFACSIEEREVLLICEDIVGDGFYNFLRWYLSEKLMTLNKFVVHSSCVLDIANNAYLFFGHSGAGKTTMTKLSAPRKVLGDDMNLICAENGIIQVEAAAIGGQFLSMIGYDKKVPVKACYWLVQDEINSLTEIDSIAANKFLIASFANLHWPTMPVEKVEQLMNFSLAVTSDIKFYELKFKNSKEVWEMLDP